MNCKVSIVNVNYNSEFDCISFVENIRKQKAIIIDIIIVDNNSPDGSGVRLKNKFMYDTDVTVILSNINLGFAKGNNLGLKYLCQEQLLDEQLIIISNNDIEISNEFLVAELVNEYSNIKQVGLLSPVMVNKGLVVKNFALKERNIWQDILLLFPLRRFMNDLFYEIDITKKNIEVDYLPGAFFIASSKIWKKINYFDEDTFLYGEERLIGRKIRDIGLKNYVCTHLQFEHRVSGIISKELVPLQKRKLIIEGRIVYHEKYTKNFIGLCILKFISNIFLKFQSFKKI